MKPKFDLHPRAIYEKYIASVSSFKQAQISRGKYFQTVLKTFPEWIDCMNKKYEPHTSSLYSKGDLRGYSAIKHSF